MVQNLKRFSKILFSSTLLIAFSSNAQNSATIKSKLTVSPLINVDDNINSRIISTLQNFLSTKNDSPSENKYWLASDFIKYKFPHSDIYSIEASKFGKNFYQPTLMEILPTENSNKSIVKIAFIGHNSKRNENQIKSIYNLMANISDDKVLFSSYLDYSTKDWKKIKSSSIDYLISPNRIPNEIDIESQKNDINKICKFFKTEPINITYFSCDNPKQIFEIKGFDYNPMMYVDSSGGLAEAGNIIFSGNNSEIYTHEVIHIYTNKLFPNIDKFLDEGLATLIAGSGKFDYNWHRDKFAAFTKQNPNYDFSAHLDPYERNYFEKETSIPYLTAALILERTYRLFGKQKLLEILSSSDDLWKSLVKVGLTRENLKSELLKESELKPIEIL